MTSTSLRLSENTFPIGKELKSKENSYRKIPFPALTPPSTEFRFSTIFCVAILLFCQSPWQLVLGNFFCVSWNLENFCYQEMRYISRLTQGKKEKGFAAEGFERLHLLLGSKLNEPKDIRHEQRTLFKQKLIHFYKFQGFFLHLYKTIGYIIYDYIYVKKRSVLSA